MTSKKHSLVSVLLCILQRVPYRRRDHTIPEPHDDEPIPYVVDQPEPIEQLHIGLFEHIPEWSLNRHKQFRNAQGQMHADEALIFQTLRFSRLG